MKLQNKNTGDIPEVLPPQWRAVYRVQRWHEDHWVSEWVGLSYQDALRVLHSWRRNDCAGTVRRLTVGRCGIREKVAEQQFSEEDSPF